MTKWRVLIIDDHPIVRRGLRQLVGEQPDFEICGEAGTRQEALDIAASTQADIAIVDLILPDSPGLGLIERLRANHPDLRLLVSSMHDERLFARRVLQLGARGYIAKQESPELMLEALRSIGRGEIWTSERVRSSLSGRNHRGAAEASPLTALTNRELEVFEMIGHGRSTREIADRLGLSVKTVETHRASIKMKLGARTSTELSQYAVQWVLEGF
ncbi:MAG TPA: response regulator transcription factor [Pirellulaceae bacterium]|nr:response regulator transcription factor [Pirellulaceae bacterium]